MRVVLVVFVGIFVWSGAALAQEPPKRTACDEKLMDAQVNETLLENELNQKRKHIASLGRQLQEERQAHVATKKELAKLQPKDEKK